MIQRIGRIALPPWFSFVIAGAIVLVALSIGLVLPVPTNPDISVAFVGNSMQYYNDFPRFMEEISNGHLHQNSCLHGNADLRNLLIWGNGMYNIWGHSGNARIGEDGGSSGLHDFGACTVAQLLFGYDADLDQRMEEGTVDDDTYEKDYSDDFFRYSCLFCSSPRATPYFSL
jgi:hypothetical protein